MDKQCHGCHAIAPGHALFTDHAFHDTGIGYAATQRPPLPERIQIAPGVFVPLRADTPVPQTDDHGRMEATGSAADRWKFKTPSLRNVAVTAPYMHDGSLATLADVIEHYDRGGINHSGLDPRLKPLELSADEKRQLIAFLQSLTSDNVAAIAADARSTLIGDVTRD